MNLNDRIGKVLKQSGLTSSEFADKIDVQRSSISHITSGRNKPSLEFIVKIKSNFPEISWDWLINGEGQMNSLLVKNEPTENKNSQIENKINASKNLFGLIDDENFGKADIEYNTQNLNSPESFKPVNNSNEEKINDSQRLENNFQNNNIESADKQEVKLKRIVIFYSNGKFESFEQ